MSAAPAERRWSLLRRLIVSLTLGLGALWLVAAAIAAWAVMYEANEVFDSAMQETAQRLLPLALDDIGEHDGEGGREIDGMMSVADHEEYLIYQIRQSDGRMLLRSHDAPPEAFDVPLRPGFDEVAGQRFFTEISSDGRLVIQVTEKRSHRAKVLFNGLLVLVAPLLLLLPMAALIIFQIVRRAIRPIGTVREAIAARGGSNLQPIAEGGLPAELAPIVRDVNRLVERLGSALESERAFAANSAHEMRTPVAAALAQVQRLSAELATTPYRSRVDQVEATLRRLANRVAKLLQLARADSGVAITSDAADLLPVLQLVIDEYARNPEAAGRIVFDDRGIDRLSARIDIDAFAIAFRNLLENALVHGDPAAAVRIWIAADRRIHIANGGIVIPPDALQRLTQRFVRGQTGAEGSGLGLAITEKILRQSGGRLELHSPAIGADAGFEAVLHLGGVH